MDPTVTVRLARPGDARTLADIQVRGWQAAYVGLLPQKTLDDLTVERRLSSWEDRVRAPGDPVAGELTLVAEMDGNVVGELVCGADTQLADKPGAAEILILYVAPEKWGRGAGYALVTEAEARLSAAGYAQVRLWVLDGNARALRAYERYGYRPTGERKHDPVFDVDDLEYRKALAPAH